MASNTAASASGLPPDLFDTTTLISLASTLLILAVAYGTSVKVLAPTTPASYRFLFIWHAFDALIHFFLEGSFLYQVRMPSSASCFSMRWVPLVAHADHRDCLLSRPFSVGNPTTTSVLAICSLENTTPRPAAGSDGETTAFAARRPPTTLLQSCGWCMLARTRDGLERTL